MGFDAIQVLAALFVVVLYQTWIHTEKVDKLGWLEGVLTRHPCIAFTTLQMQIILIRIMGYFNTLGQAIWNVSR